MKRLKWLVAVTLVITLLASSIVPVLAEEPSNPSEQAHSHDVTAPAAPAPPAEPAAPAAPSAPVEPTAPVEPAAPTEPSAPVAPSDPTGPSALGEPAAPTEPAAPADSNASAAPSDSTEPSAPGELGDPVDSAMPTDPSAPVEPTIPTDPVVPEEPSDPVEPSDSADPAAPIDSQLSEASVPPTDPDALVDLASITDLPSGCVAGADGGCDSCEACANGGACDGCEACESEAVGFTTMMAYAAPMGIVPQNAPVVAGGIVPGETYPFDIADSKGVEGQLLLTFSDPVEDETTGNMIYSLTAALSNGLKYDNAAFKSIQIKDSSGNVIWSSKNGVDPWTGSTKIVDGLSVPTGGWIEITLKGITTTGSIVMCSAHRYVKKDDGGKGADCITSGMATYECENCGKTEMRANAQYGNHAWGAPVEVVAPTCTEEGTTVLTCGVCEQTKDGAPIPLVEHAWGEPVEVVAPTCTEEGTTVLTCGVCKQTKDGAPIPLVEHAWGEPVEVVAPTCTEEGTTVLTCGVCKQTKDGAPIPLVEHAWGEPVVGTAATCEEEGIMKHECTECGEEKDGETIPKLPHTWGDPVVGTAATCEEEGIMKHECTECGEEKDGETIPKLQHAWGEPVVGTAATCEEEGIMKHECTECGEEKDGETIPAIGHAWEQHTPELHKCENPSCTVTETHAFPAIGTPGNGSIQYVCDGCGFVKNEAIPDRSTENDTSTGDGNPTGNGTPTGDGNPTGNGTPTGNGNPTTGNGTLVEGGNATGNVPSTGAGHITGTTAGGNVQNLPEYNIPLGVGNPIVRGAGRAGGDNTRYLFDEEIPLAASLVVAKLLNEDYVLQHSFQLDAMAGDVLTLESTTDWNAYVYEINFGALQLLHGEYPNGAFAIRTQNLVADVPFALYDGLSGLAEFLQEENIPANSAWIRIIFVEDAGWTVTITAVQEDGSALRYDLNGAGQSLVKVK